LGDVGNDGPSDTDYAAIIAQRQQTASSGPFQTGASPTAFADMEQSYSPINASTGGATAGRVTVGEGDTLRSIAAAVWGDASLWYMIAQANGLSGAESLAAGSTLAIPAKVSNFHHTSETFRVYDPNKAIGDINPTEPAPVTPQAKAKAGCGGAIILAIIAVAVTAIVLGPASTAMAQLFNAGAAAALPGVAVVGTSTVAAASAAGIAGAIAGGAIAGAVGSFVSQVFGVVTGLQDKLSWKGVAMAAISGAVGGGMGGPTQGLSGVRAIAEGVARGALSNIAVQRVAVATGLQHKFDWTGVAVGAVVGGVASGVSTSNLLASSGGFTNSMISGAAGGLAGAATRSLIDGTSFGDNILAALPDVIGSTIGNAIGGRLAARSGWAVDTVSADPDTIVDLTPSGEAPLQVWRPDDPGTLSQAPFINASDLSYDYSGSGSAGTITAGAARRGAGQAPDSGEDTFAGAANHNVQGLKVQRLSQGLIAATFTDNGEARTIQAGWTGDADWEVAYSDQGVWSVGVGPNEGLTSELKPFWAYGQSGSVESLPMSPRSERGGSGVHTIYGDVSPEFFANTEGADEFISSFKSTVVSDVVGTWNGLVEFGRNLRDNPQGMAFSALQFAAKVSTDQGRLELVGEAFNQGYAAGVALRRDYGQAVKSGTLPQFYGSMAGHVTVGAVTTVATDGAGALIGAGVKAVPGLAKFGGRFLADTSGAVRPPFAGTKAVGGVKPNPSLLGLADDAQDLGINLVHGNSLSSKVKTTLYGLYDSFGNFLKWGVTGKSPIEKRYSKSFMEDKKMLPFRDGTRSDMVALERKATERRPGPLNKESWAGKKKK
jgi:hypothetical protein